MSVPADRPMLQLQASLPDGQVLDLSLHPGLTLVTGGEGRGKTWLLRQLAGQAAREALDASFEQPADEADDQQLASTWLARRRAAHSATWSPAVEAALVDAFALAEHLPKQLLMLSTGSRRKLGLLAGAASGAALVLLDQPHAALDGRSIRVLNELLAEAAQSRSQAWVVADYAPHAGLAGVPLAARVDLGD